MREQKFKVAPCIICVAPGRTHLRYAGWSVGWACSEHSKVLLNDKIQVQDIANMLRKDGSFNIIPRTWIAPGHPFKLVADNMIAKGVGILAPEFTVKLGVPQPIKLNRRARRAQGEK